MSRITQQVKEGGLPGTPCPQMATMVSSSLSLSKQQPSLSRARGAVQSCIKLCQSLTMVVVNLAMGSFPVPRAHCEAGGSCSGRVSLPWVQSSWEKSLALEL